MKRALFFAAFVSVLSTAQAMDLSTPFDVGANVPNWTSPNGDTCTRLAPSLIDVSNPLVVLHQGLLMDWFVQNTGTIPPIFIGDPLSGVANVRQQNGDGWDSGPGTRFIVGGSFQIDYVGPEQADLRWFVTYSFAAPGTYNPWQFNQGFDTSHPFYNSEDNDQYSHDASTNTYQLASNVYSNAPVGNYTWAIMAFPVTVFQDSNGVVSSAVFHDGILLSADVHLAEATPEPASFLALGLFALPLLRRGNRKA